MQDVQKIGVALTREQIAALETAVESGEYATTGEIVRQAIRDWQFRQKLRREDIRRLHKLWEEGKATVRRSHSISTNSGAKLAAGSKLS